jgi:flagellar biosynthetic protein FliP
VDGRDKPGHDEKGPTAAGSSPRIGGSAALLALAVSLLASPAFAQSMTIDLGEAGGTATGRIIQLMVLVTVLSLAPAILITVTSFTRIIIVLSFVRNALGLQQTPPNTVLVSLALFLTGFVMAPTFQTAWQDGVAPLIDEKITEAEAFDRTVAPLERFMLGNVRDQDVKLFLDLAHLPPVAEPKDTPLRVLVPAFMISELRRAFEIGFLLFLPFLIIDMVVASILMSMGMMMLPSAMISLPFKVIFFVLVDGWYLVAGSLVQSFAGSG